MSPDKRLNRTQEVVGSIPISSTTRTETNDVTPHPRGGLFHSLRNGNVLGVVLKTS